MPLVNLSSIKDFWHGEFAPLAETYAAQKKSPDIASIDLGRWTTNKVAQLEPREQDDLYALKPSLRLLYERSASGEMQQLGPDLEYLINSNLRSTLSGLDLVRGRNHLRGGAAEFAAEPEAVLMPDAPTLQVQGLHNTPRPTVSTNHLLIPASDTKPEPSATYRLYFRRAVEKVDENDELTGDTIMVTDHGNYFEGALTREDANRLRLTFTSTNFNEHIRGPPPRSFGATRRTLPDTDLNHWQLTKLRPYEAPCQLIKLSRRWAPFGWGSFHYSP